jgi:MYXO-CTERM domain-containing protein
LNLHPSRGAISLCGPGCEADLVSDHNVVSDRFTRDDGTVIDLAAWQGATGQDENSVISDSATVFADAAGADYHPTANGPAIDSGTTMNAPAADLEGNARPAGTGIDIGAYEHCGTDCVPAGGAGGTSSMGEGGSGNDAGTAGNPTTGGAGGRGGNTASGGAGAGGASGGTAGTPASGGTGRGGSGGSNAVGGNAGRPAGSGGASAGTAGRAAAGTSDVDGGCACRIGKTGNASRSSLVALLALVLFAKRRVRRRTS